MIVLICDGVHKQEMMNLVKQANCTASDTTYLSRFRRWVLADSLLRRYSSSYHTYQRNTVNNLRYCGYIRSRDRTLHLSGNFT